jgi:hypothetical protein
LVKIAVVVSTRILVVRDHHDFSHSTRREFDSFSHKQLDTALGEGNMLMVEAILTELKGEPGAEEKKEEQKSAREPSGTRRCPICSLDLRKSRFASDGCWYWSHDIHQRRMGVVCEYSEKV